MAINKYVNVYVIVLIIWMISAVYRNPLGKLETYKSFIKYHSSHLGCINNLIAAEIPTKNKLVATLSTFTKEYTVEHEYKLTGPFTDGWYSALYIVARYNSEYSRGIASSSFHYVSPNLFLKVHSPVNNITHYYTSPAIPLALELNHWVKVSVNQFNTADGYVYKVEVGNNEVLKVINTKPMEFHDVQVYISGNKDRIFPGKIRNLIIKGNFVFRKLTRVLFTILLACQHQCVCVCAPVCVCVWWGGGGICVCVRVYVSV